MFGILSPEVAPQVLYHLKLQVDYHIKNSLKQEINENDLRT